MEKDNNKIINNILDKIEVDKDLLTKYVTDFTEFIQINDVKNMNDLIEDDSIAFQKGNQLFADCLKVIYDISKNANIDDIINIFASLWNGDEFWDYYKGLIDFYINNQNKSDYFTSMDIEKKRALLWDVFYNLYLNKDERVTEVNEEIINFILSVLKTCESYILVRRLTQKAFIEKLKVMFNFKEEDINLIWDMFINNKDTIMMNYIIEQIDNINYRIDNIEDKIKEIINNEN